MKKTIVIIGAGNMGASLAGGLIANHFPSDSIWVADPDTLKLDHLHQQLGIRTTQNNQEASTHADIILLAVKPQIMKEALAELAPIVQTKKPLIISIAAGTREKKIQEELGGQVAIVRAMPNTPALIGAGATALYANSFVNEEQKTNAESILRSIGLTVWIQDEDLMDIITALSGSGPAYFFLLIEVLQDAAAELGLPKEIARLLTLQTAYGASRMALESENDVVTLRKQVTSPGGTTEQAVRVLEENNLRDIFKKALTAAQKRAHELGK